MIKEYSQKELLDKLPSSWDDFTFRDFKKLFAVDVRVEMGNDVEDMFVGIDNNIKVLSVLLDISEENLEVQELNVIMPLINKIGFMRYMPVINEKECSIKWKDFDTLTYNDYVILVKSMDKTNENMELIISAISTNRYKSEEVLDLSMTDIHTGFFLLRRCMKKYIRNTLPSLMRKAAIQLIKQKLQLFKTKSPKVKKS